MDNLTFLETILNCILKEHYFILKFCLIFLYTVHSAGHSKQYTIHFTLYILHYTMYSVKYIIYIIYNTISIIYYTIVHYTFYIIHYTLNAIQLTICTLHYILYTQYTSTLLTVQCTVYTIQSSESCNEVHFSLVTILGSHQTSRTLVPFRASLQEEIPLGATSWT